MAQSLIVSIPSTDVTREGISMIAHESQLNTWSKSTASWNSFTFATRGVGYNIELAATMFGLSSPGSGNVALAVGYKHRLPLAPSSTWEPTLAWGQMLPISLSDQGLGNWTYGVTSFRLPLTKTRWSGGVSYGTKQIFGRTALSAMVGVEQPIYRGFSLIADWFSGGHDLGALVVGNQINVSHSLVVISGYKIPNRRSNSSSAVLVEVTYEF